ncbi:hypothetical protein BASA60_007466 [Batrachochytrium salamandrivorans]|nr:hypothetical protein BASA60_007466 [Batrachochytrium salamandrivorans]
MAEIKALDIYTKGTRAWFPDEDLGWVMGSLTNKTLDATSNKLVMSFFVEHRKKEVVFESTMQKLEANRFQDLPPLINPPKLAGCDDLTNLSYLHEYRLNIYTSEIMREYSGKRRDELEPHLFAVAEQAYRNMIKEKKNQSIIISGRICISRVGSSVEVSGVSALAGNTTGNEKRLYFLPIPSWEAFGNSKTSRNDNSSRFGKYIEIMFENKTDGPGVRITGAKIRTYLLERSRLVFQPQTERNYHIFYQLCAAAPAAERKELGLGTWENFFYLNQGGTGVRPNCLAWSPPLSKNGSLRSKSLPETEKIVTSLNIIQATTGRDSVAKFIYSMLFDWIVKIVNLNLTREEASKDGRFIGVLDIYGFEHFKKNSFEQFCINYANEKLQQEFNAHVFKLEQEEYVAEKITWSFIEFNDNQPCIDMIENKLGILDLLDEESRLPSGADSSLITKLYQRFGTAQSKFFEKPRFGQQAFTIKHYACDVTYEIEGFIDKNKDTVADEQLAMLNETEVKSSAATPGRRAGNTTKKATLGSIFKASLVQLMETIRQTEVHYIVVLSPTNSKVAFEFEAPMVLSQLRACGVLETIRISCADEDKYQIGLSKIFFRAGQIAYIEKLRSERFRECGDYHSKEYAQAAYQNQYRRMRKAAIVIQTAVRGYRARALCKTMRQTSAAIVIQKFARGYISQPQGYHYRLEGKVVELSQNFAAKAKENAELLDRVSTLEFQLSSWKDRFTKIDTEVVPRAAMSMKKNSELKREISSLTESRDTASRDSERMAALVRKRDQEITQLRDENTGVQEELKKLKDQIKKRTQDC